MAALLERPATLPGRPAPPRLPGSAGRATAAGRDPFIDALRVFGMALVVAQHWTIPVLAFDGTTLTTGNALATPGLWAVTWLSQVMPLVFFAGGAANAIGLRRARHDAPRWLFARLRRLA
ncbi:acyltransferase, partial [Nonomuraea lactucae]|uniref:acyltransferase n=1 Tax=Nonomuraea lactucae TaxID=2249762 RepID=UPI001F068159